MSNYILIEILIFNGTLSTTARKKSKVSIVQKRPSREEKDALLAGKGTGGGKTICQPLSPPVVTLDRGHRAYAGGVSHAEGETLTPPRA